MSLVFLMLASFLIMIAETDGPCCGNICSFFTVTTADYCDVYVISPHSFEWDKRCTVQIIHGCFGKRINMFFPRFIDIKILHV